MGGRTVGDGPTDRCARMDGQTEGGREGGIEDRWTDGRTDGRTEKRDGWADVHGRIGGGRETYADGQAGLNMQADGVHGTDSS